MRQEYIKILEKNVGSNLFDIGHNKFFQDMSPKAKETKAKMNFWDFTKIKSFCTAKETVKQNKEVTHRMGEDICKWQYSQKADIQDLSRTQTQHTQNR